MKLYFDNQFSAWVFKCGRLQINSHCALKQRKYKDKDYTSFGFISVWCGHNCKFTIG